MTTLTGTTPANTYKDLLQVSNSNSGIDGTLRAIEDGEGTASPLSLSSTSLAVNTSTLFVDSATGRVGIGDITPQCLLDIGGTAAGSVWAPVEIKTGLRIWDAGSSSHGMRFGFDSNVPYIQGYRETVGVTDLKLQNSGGATILGGSLAIDSTTQSTSTTTGSIQTDGGLGVVKDAFFGGDLDVTDILSVDGINIEQTVNAQSGTTYTLVAADNRALITLNNASDITVTLPQQSTLTTAAGFTCKLLNIGAGTVTVVKEGAETLTGNTTLSTNAEMIIERQTTTSWATFGGTATISEQITVAIVASLVDDKVYDVFVPNFSGTILALSLRNTSASTPGTYSAKIDGTTITGLSAIANNTTRTITSATALNTFTTGQVISYVPTGMTSVVDAFITITYTRDY